MKKRIATLLCVGFLAFGLTGCGEEAEKTHLQQEIAQLSAEKTELKKFYRHFKRDGNRRKRKN